MNRTHKAISVTALALCSLLLAGCNEEDNVADTNRAVLASAKAEQDPLVALAKIDAQIEAAGYVARNYCSFMSSSTSCAKFSKSMGELEQERLARVKQSLDKMPAGKLLDYYADQDTNTLWADIAPRLVALAKNAAGSMDDRALLYTAGRILTEGTHVIRNTDQATELFARAWLAGSQSAAGANAQLYASIHDANNAYLWALRCKEACNSGEYFMSKYSLRDKLSAEAIRQAEQAALDSSILALGGH
ncbi:hypothetical protein ACU4GI_33445 [Cupriavidus basilensis]